MRRRSLALAALGAALPLKARAQEFPDRPIALVQGFGPGGNADVLARLAAGPLSAGLGQPVVVETRTGAGGNIATEYVARARPDGHTLVLLTGGHTAGAAIYRRLPYDPVEDLTFIGSFVQFPFVLATRADAPWRTLAEVIAAAKAAPGTLTYATSGTGTTQHLTGELLAERAGIRWNHVPYRGGTAPLGDVLSGRVDLYLDTVTTTGPGVRDGRLRPLGISSKDVWPLLPEAPPMARTVPGFEVLSWAGIAGPANMPPGTVSRLNAELRKAMELPEVQERMAVLGAVPRPDTPAEFLRFVSDQVAQWRQVVSTAGIERQ